MNAVHGVSINKIAKMVQHHYSTVQSIIQTYMEHGQTSNPDVANEPEEPHIAALKNSQSEMLNLTGENADTDPYIIDLVAL